jgi:hypothetical protein
MRKRIDLCFGRKRINIEKTFHPLRKTFLLQMLELEKERRMA